MCMCVTERGTERDGEQGQGWCIFPELSKVLSLSDRISSVLVPSLEMWCVHYSQDALCGVFICISHPLSHEIVAQDSLLT